MLSSLSKIISFIWIMMLTMYFVLFAGLFMCNSWLCDFLSWDHLHVLTFCFKRKTGKFSTREKTTIYFWVSLLSINCGKKKYTNKPKEFVIVEGGNPPHTHTPSLKTHNFNMYMCDYLYTNIQVYKYDNFVLFSIINTRPQSLTHKHLQLSVPSVSSWWQT